MTENEGQATEKTVEIDKGPTEELRDLEKPATEKLVPGGEIPGAQNPASDEIKDEKNVNTE
jgi:hypothetical protein